MLYKGYASSSFKHVFKGDIMKLAVFGSGYVGLVSGICFADFGNQVICADIDQGKIEGLKKGKIPIYEPGLGELLERAIKSKRILFTTDLKKAIQDSDVLFICVGTPALSTGKADLSAVEDVAKAIADSINGYKVVVLKSTVPVGTCDRVKKIIEKEMKNKQEFDVVSNPEFLREGVAVKDFQNPYRIVVGAESEKARSMMAELYKPVARTTRPLVFMDLKSSELTKYASNAMLATRISFMNELAHLCEDVGADIKQISKGMGLDTRIGPRFLSAGIGYGGSCFPKDVKALAHILDSYGHETNILRAVDHVNEKQKKVAVQKLKKFLPDLEKKKIAIWGLSFKPRTDDIRDAPSLTVIEQLLEEFAEVYAFDPEAAENMKLKFKKVHYTDTAMEALKDADALLLLTEWDEFRNPDFEEMKKLMKQRIIIDGRNVYEPEQMRALGFKYDSIGRK